MAALEEFEVTVTFCFTPEHRGVGAHHTSPPLDIAEYADFCARMIRRYAPAASNTLDPAASQLLLRVDGKPQLA